MCNKVLITIKTRVHGLLFHGNNRGESPVYLDRFFFYSILALLPRTKVNGIPGHQISRWPFRAEDLTMEVTKPWAGSIRSTRDETRKKSDKRETIKTIDESACWNSSSLLSLSLRPARYFSSTCAARCLPSAISRSLSIRFLYFYVFNVVLFHSRFVFVSFVLLS